MNDCKPFTERQSQDTNWPDIFTSSDNPEGQASMADNQVRVPDLGNNLLECSEA